jgi:hypothetical protein
MYIVNQQSLAAGKIPFWFKAAAYFFALLMHTKYDFKFIFILVNVG